MNAKSLNALLSVLVVALAAFALYQSRTISELETQLAQKPDLPPPAIVAEKPAPAPAPEPAAVQPEPEPTPAVAAAAMLPPAETDADNESNDGQRVMRDFAKMLENPQMNEVMQASQRATLEVMYKDLLDSYQLSPDERKHLMDLLMARQMFRVETSMKMMGGDNDPDEMKALGEEMKEYDKVVKSEIDTFLNNQEDSSEFEFYEKTMGERMALSGLKANLAKAQIPLGEGVDRQLVQIMADQKEAHTFKSDLADEQNYNMGPDRFSAENIDALAQDLEQVHAAIAQEAAAILTPEQLEALSATLTQMRQMQISQIKMAANMFGSKPKS